MALHDLVHGHNRLTALAKREERPDLFTSLQHEMNRLFEEFHRGWGITPFSPAMPSVFAPAANVTENDKDVCVTIELPGMDEKSIDLTLSRNCLTIKGEKSEEQEKTGKSYYRMERCFGSFQRDIQLPCDVETERAEACFKKGILTVTLPKSKESMRSLHKIKIAKS